MATTGISGAGAEGRLRPEQDGREMCFSQGKPCVYQSEADENAIITEWPNGVVERMDTRTNTVQRTWPDGSIETFAAGSRRDATYPHVK